MPYPPPLYSTHPLRSSLLTSVGEHERRRIVRHYYPEGDPDEMAWQMAVAKKYGLSVNPYLAQAGRVYKLWYGADRYLMAGIGLLLVGVVAGFIVRAIRNSLKKKT